MKWYKLILFSLVSGLLLTFSWYPHGLPFLIFFALIPMFLMSDHLLEKGSKVALWKGLIFSYPGFVLWNALTTYWICNTTVPGGIAASVLNALLMSMVFGLWHCCRKYVKHSWTHPVLFAAFWISFEYLHLNWDLTWPWLNLGNVFAVCPRWVQWYSVTGALGGTFWIIALNFLMYCILVHQRIYKTRAWGLAAAFLGCLIIPIIWSACLYKSTLKNIDKSTPIEAVVVQPNTEVWEEEYSLTNTEEAQRILDVTRPFINDKTNLVVCPESSIAHSIYLKALQTGEYPKESPSYACFPLLDSSIAMYPNLNFILGLSTYDVYDHKATITAKQMDAIHFMDFYNTAVFYNKNQYSGHYHKSRLVPGVESLPFPKVFGFLSDMLVNLGGVSSSLGKDTQQRVFSFEANGNLLKAGTAICYESIYGELVGHFVRNGANVLTVITNDSWWKDTPGHKQHFEMARLRAVETHRYVLRAANGGFSGVINPAGDVEQKTKYEERTALHATVYAQHDMTFYAKHGDYLAVIAMVLTAAGLLYTIICGFLTINKKRKNSIA
ncbi:MAG: apolipoprotein N-acyltransferase [Bacteroidales bacterium]|nr:apolipoprotein N-acyltransferase [Bacteroidales bacterium]